MPQEDPIRFTLTAVDDASKPIGVRYTLEQHPDDVNRVLRSDGKVEADRRQVLRMNFTLVDDSTKNLEFNTDVGNVFLVKEGESCPTRQDTAQNDSFPKNRFRVNKPGQYQVLTVANLNLVAATYCYRICINGDGQERDFDPVIINGGGGQGRSPWGGLLAILLGLGALAGVAYYAGLFE